MSRASKLVPVLAAAAALLLLFASFTATPVQAQGWTCNWSFSAGVPSGWTLANGTITGAGIQTAGGGGYYVAQVNWPSEVGTTITSVTVTFNRTASVYANYGGSLLTYGEGVGSGTFTRSGSGSATSGTWYLATDSSSAMYLVSANMTGTGTDPCAGPTSTPTPVTPTATPSLTPSPTPTVGITTYRYDVTGSMGPFETMALASGYGTDTEAIWVEGSGWRAKELLQVTAEGDHMHLRFGIRACLASTMPLRYLRIEHTALALDNAHSGFNGFSHGTWASANFNASATAHDAGIADEVAGSSLYWQEYPTADVRTIGGVIQSVNHDMFPPASLANTFMPSLLDETFITAIEVGFLSTAGAPEWIGCDGLPIGPPPTVDLTCPTGDLSEGYTYELEAETTGSVTAWAWDFGDGNTSTEADGLVEFSWPVPGTYTVEVEVTGPRGTASDDCEITILRIGNPGSGGGALYRPLSESDQDTELYTDGLFSAASDWIVDPAYLGYVGPDDETVIAISKAVNAPVYAVADGTVLSIDPVMAGQCHGIGSTGPVAPCTINLYAEYTVTGFDSFATLTINPAGLYRVQVSFIAGERIEYFVLNAPQYVREGQQLLAGCIVGETTPFSNLWQNTGSDLAETYAGMNDVNLDSRGLTWLQRVTEVSGDVVQIPIIAQLYVFPDPATACNAGGEYADCLFDPTFQDQGAYRWTVTGTVSKAAGFTLMPGSSIALNGLTLDAATAYSFTVWATRPSTYAPQDARMLLGIGTTEATFILQESIRTPYPIASATHAADQGPLYSVRIVNVGSAPFTVLQNCVTTGTPDVRPSTCYFQNYSFDTQLTGWSTTGTVVPGDAPGMIVVASDEATIGQNVRLYADGGGGDHTYTVIMKGVYNAPAGSASSMTVRYRFGGGTWITPSVSGWSPAGQNLSALNREHTLEFDVPSGTFSGVMEFQFDFIPMGGEVVGTDLALMLNSVCLSDAGSWAHHPDGGGSNWTPGGNGCDVAAPPLELQDDFGAWISYHLDGMSDIYYCDVIPQLEQLNNVTYGIYEYAQWTGLYAQAANAQVWTWADNSLFPWLGGHLSNIARAAGGSMTIDAGGGCSDIWCVLSAMIDQLLGPIVALVGRIVDTLLGLVNLALDVLTPLVEAIVGFFVTLINGIGGILGSLLTLITSFITGITNAQPAPVPGLPNCAIDPNSSAICAVMFGLEHTIFADEGAAIIPLFIAILSIVQLNWFISKVSELIQEVTSRV